MNFDLGRIVWLPKERKIQAFLSGRYIRGRVVRTESLDLEAGSAPDICNKNSWNVGPRC